MFDHDRVLDEIRESFWRTRRGASSKRTSASDSNASFDSTSRAEAGTRHQAVRTQGEFDESLVLIVWKPG